MIEAHPWHYDGRNATRWTPLLQGDEHGFRLIGQDWESGPHRWADLVALDVAGDDRVFGHGTEDGWRIGFVGDVPPALDALLPRPSRYGGWIDRAGVIKASVAFAALAALAVLVVVKSPQWLAPLVPQSAEDRMGDAMVGDFGGRFCSTPQGSAALSALIARIDPDHKARTIEVANIPMVNAVALPGRHVIIFRGLLEQAESVDEVAGVLAHELGHVKHRHTLSAMMRQLGLSVVLGGADSRIGQQFNALLGLSYTRGAEREADEYAVASLREANISPAATARFFARSGAEQEKKGQGKEKASKPKKKAETSATDFGEWFTSHPSAASRRTLFAKSIVVGHVYTPALNPQQWQALKAICAQDKSAKSGWNSAL